MNSKETFSFSRLFEKSHEQSWEALAVVLFDDAGAMFRVSRAELMARAAHYSDFLRSKGIEHGQNVLLCLPHSVELVSWLCGCFLSQVVPSILASPARGRGEKGNWERIRRAACQVDAAAAVVTREWKNELQLELKDMACQVLSSGSERIDAGVPKVWSSPDMNIPGYVQFTSGSTGSSKGVVLSGAAIKACLQSMAEAIALTKKDTVVSCLPLSHDFGLFAGMLMPLMAGVPVVLISPSMWVRRPAMLLQQIHNCKGTIAWLPNSGFVHCARFVRDREMADIDLKGLRLIINGAEPILHSSNQMFLTRFSEYGLKESALATGYGMAENTLGVTYSMPGKRAPVVFVHGPDLANKGIVRIVPEANPNSVAVVSCGQPLKGTKIQILGKGGDILPEFYVGEIVIQSESLFSEYAGDKISTDQALVDGWFHTGDLGFMIGNDLFFSGRIKDLIIVGGRNISPVELERVAAEVPGVRSGQVVAFGVPDESLGTERIVIVCAVRMSEHSETKDTLVRKIRQHIAGKTGMSVSEVRLVRKGWIEKTGNGKLARSRNREKYIREGSNGNG